MRALRKCASCELCVDITSMKVAERTGSSDKLLAVADWRQSPLFSDEERLALEYAEAARNAANGR